MGENKRLNEILDSMTSDELIVLVREGTKLITPKAKRNEYMRRYRAKKALKARLAAQEESEG